MKHVICCLLLGCFIFQSQSLLAQKVDLITENIDEKVHLYAINKELCPVSINLELKLKNLIFSERSQEIFIVPAGAEKFQIGYLTLKNPNAKSKFSYTFTATKGDITKTSYDYNFEYDLPYPTGKTYKIYQGYNSTPSHQNEKALDFSMDEGSLILAARGGLVIELVQNNNKGCTRPECQKYANFVTIYHSDGSFAMYVHLKKNGVAVKIGDQVNKGDTIGYSGNTGWSSGPHLHFTCFIPSVGKPESIATKFRVGDGTQIEFLKEKSSYARNYD